MNQRTNGPVNAHLISWPSKAQNIQNLENIWLRNDVEIQNSHTFIISISCLHLPTFRSQAAIVSEKSSFEQTMMGWSTRCYIPLKLVEIGPPVPEKIFEGFIPYMGLAAILVM